MKTICFLISDFVSFGAIGITTISFNSLVSLALAVAPKSGRKRRIVNKLEGLFMFADCNGLGGFWNDFNTSAAERSV